MSITEIMAVVRKNNPILTINDGTFFCDYGSHLLYDALAKSNFDMSKVKFLQFKYPKNGDARIKRISDAANFLKNDNCLNVVYNTFQLYGIDKYSNRPDFVKTVGHMVLFIDDKCYDITSDQIDMPTVYNLSDVSNMWNTHKFVKYNNVLVKSVNNLVNSLPKKYIKLNESGISILVNTRMLISDWLI